MDKIISEPLKYISILLTLIIILFTIYESVETRKILIKEKYLNALLNWQNSNQKLMCYIRQSKDNSLFSKELVDSTQSIVMKQMSHY